MYHMMFRRPPSVTEIIVLAVMIAAGWFIGNALIDDPGALVSEEEIAATVLSVNSPTHNGSGSKFSFHTTRVELPDGSQATVALSVAPDVGDALSLVVQEYEDGTRNVRPMTAMDY